MSFVHTRKVIAADLFCGAGGSSQGLVGAAAARSIPLELLAVNHWPIAVETHQRNHPQARHLCADLSTVDPSKAIPGGRLDILIASPECTHHSVARGGKPCSDQSRASAWHVLHWVERLRVDRVLIENVIEFQSWGPLGRRGRPLKAKRGKTFKAFVAALESLGYEVEWRVLNAADYGDATSRRRLFIQASRRGPVVWPEPTHAGRWRAAREIIDWDIKGESIFDRKRPLAPRTMDRIEAGLRKFGGEAFIAVLRGYADGSGVQVQSLADPLATVSAGGTHQALCEPFVIGQQSGAAARSVGNPLPTVATAGAISLCEPFIVTMEHSGRQPIRSCEQPLPTITTAKGGAFGVCEPFVLNTAHEGADESRVRSVRAPLSAIPAGHRGELALCEPFVTKYYGTAKSARPVTEPLETITAKDRFALVEPGRLDIRFRMLQPHELARAMGFDGYEFAGTKTDQVRQIGNAVAVRTARALCGSIIDSIQA